MSRGAKIGILIAAAVVAVGLLAYINMDRRSDREKVLAALEESIQASKEGRPGGVLEYISNQFKFNEQDVGMRNLSKIIRDNRPEVEVLEPEPQIEGDQARMNSDVKLTVRFGPSEFSHTFQNVEMRFEKESAREMLIIPSEKWRLVSVTVPEDQVPMELGFGGLGGF